MNNQTNTANLRETRGEEDDRLQEAVARARRSPFYSRHLQGHSLRSRQDLPLLPLTFRSHLLDASPYGMLTIPASKAWHYHETSGTTGGQPISTWCGLTELRKMAATVHASVPELASDTILLNRFPLFAPVSFVFEEALRLAEACHIAAGNMSWDVPFQRVLDFMGKIKATTLRQLYYLTESVRTGTLVGLRELYGFDGDLYGAMAVHADLREPWSKLMDSVTDRIDHTSPIAMRYYPRVGDPSCGAPPRLYVRWVDP